jgi:hypothetical protein
MLSVVLAAAMSHHACGTDDTGTNIEVMTDGSTGDAWTCPDGVRLECACPDGSTGAAVCNGGMPGACECDAAEDAVGADSTADVESDAAVDEDADVVAEPDPDSLDDVAAEDVAPDDAAEDAVDDGAADAEEDATADVADADDVDDTAVPGDVLLTDAVEDVTSVDVATDATDVTVPDVAQDVVDVRDATDVAEAADIASTPDVLVDPCVGVPPGGNCLDATTLQTCVTAAGTDSRFLRRDACRSGRTCSIQDGVAACRAPFVCTDGATRCESGTVLETCVSNAWRTTSCDAGTFCEAAAAGSACVAAGPTRLFSSRLSYEYRPVRSDLTNWDTAAFQMAEGIYVVSYNNGVAIDSTFTGSGADGGLFDIQVPSIPDANDFLTFFAYGLTPDGGIRFVIANPGSTGGSVSLNEWVNNINVPADRYVWQWSFPTASVLDFPTGFGLPMDYGSGAMHLFGWVDYIWTTLESWIPLTSPEPLVVWWDPGNRFSCGACAVEWPANLAGQVYQHQVFISGGTDEGVWSDPVTVHELGHVVMSAWGASPTEGGPHYIGVPVHPGMAWSEGWATAFSAFMRDDSRYWDKQGGGMFWFDINTRDYAGSAVWRRPTPAGGLLQLIDENEVAAMIWRIAQVIGDDGAIDVLNSRRATRPLRTRVYGAVLDRIQHDHRSTRAVDRYPCIGSLFRGLCRCHALSGPDVGGQPEHDHRAGDVLSVQRQHGDLCGRRADPTSGVVGRDA